MKIYYEKGRSIDGDWVVDEEKEEQITGISVKEFIDKLKLWADAHPNGYIQADTQVCMLETDKIEECGYYLYMQAERDEV